MSIRTWTFLALGIVVAIWFYDTRDAQRQKDVEIKFDNSHAFNWENDSKKKTLEVK